MWNAFVVMFVILMISLGLTGNKFVTGNTYAQSPNQQAELNPNTKAADLRVMLNSMHKQHVDLAANAMRDGYNQLGGEDFKASAQALDNNSLTIADAVGSIYGSNTRDSLLEAWRKHIDSYMNYTLALKNNDQDGMDRAMADLNNRADQLANILSSANPDLSRNDIRQMIAEHGEMMLAIVDAYASGDRRGSYDRQNDAYNQIGQIADGLAGAIIKQYPDKF